MPRDEIYSAISECRICRGTTLSPVLDLGRQALTGVFPKSSTEETPAGPLQLVLCADCGLAQLAHNYDLSMLYGNNYGYRSGLNNSMVRHLTGKVKAIESLVPLSEGDLVLDIGSNDGTLLGRYSVAGLRRIGIDPSGPKFLKYYPAGVELVPEFFSSAALRRVVPGGKAKVITSIAMFYDLERPKDFVAQIAEVLHPEGVWVFEQSYLPSMVATNSYDTVCHEHIEYYALRQIEAMLSEAGMKIVALEENDVNGGSFSVTAAPRSSALPSADTEVRKMLREEERLGYGTTKPFVGLIAAMEQHRSELLDLLNGIRSRGERVLGYGASTKGNVLLQYCGIGPDLLPCIAEVNEDKFGSFTPATKIPIVSETEARKMAPDYFLVLPWHFRSGILAKEGEFLEQGGRFIFPLPTVQVISRQGVQAAASMLAV